MTRPDLNDLLRAASIATAPSCPKSETTYFLDNNVVSELRRPRPHGGVLEWIAKVPAEHHFVSAVTTGADLVSANGHFQHVEGIAWVPLRNS